jgi:O-acetyl-ADP-ribose deacetylase (regulator of RNase III)
MIRYKKGNLLDAETQALVNTVNTVGVMGKGIALQFKTRFPNNYKVYRDACKAGTFKTGQVLVVAEGDLLNQKIVVNFPTKEHWKAPSKYEYIESGLKALNQAVKDYGITSIAIPPLGCGNGGLAWNIVKPMIEKELQNLEADIIIYEPNEQIKDLLQKESSPQEIKLTPARAMLLYLLFRYEAGGEQSSLFVANKLAYFLQRSGENLKLKFEAHHYGPYTVQLNHVLYYLNGVYLKGLEQNTAKPFEPLKLNYEKWDEIQAYVETELSAEQRQRLHDVTNLVSRFESTFSLELLATVDFVVDKEKLKSTPEIMSAINAWNTRKTNLFQEKQVEIAMDRLRDYAGNSLAFL